MLLLMPLLPAYLRPPEVLPAAKSVESLAWDLLLLRPAASQVLLQPPTVLESPRSPLEGSQLRLSESSWA